MKIKILIAVITFVILAALSAAGLFVYKTIIEPEPQKEEFPAAVGEEVLKETRLVKDDFEITLPPGWQEATTTYEGFLLLAFDAKEDISAGNFQKFDFRTNLSIKSDDLSKYGTLDTLEKYIESVKTSLIQTIPSISFNRQDQKTINGAEAVLIECSSRQEETDFKTLIVFIKGNSSIIYAVSFNVFQSSWENYKNVFEKIAQSFKFRYDI